VVIELFSSEGCSSCPPADAALSELDSRQSVDGVVVLALEEHVDYWDDLGWRDPFAQAGFGARQGRYAAVLTSGQVFTPELVIDGHAVGDVDVAHLAQSVRESGQEPKAMVRVKRQDDGIDVVVQEVPAAAGDDDAEVWLAVTESGLSTRVLRGENRGRHVLHAPVVRMLRKLGSVRAGTFHIAGRLEMGPSWDRSKVRVVVFVQRVQSRRIVGAGSS
jgi:hypothetical protein